MTENDSLVKTHETMTFESSPGQTGGAIKHWATVVLCIVAVILYTLEFVAPPEIGKVILHIFVVILLVSLILLLMKGKHIFVKDETRLTSHGFFFSSIMVPLFSVIGGLVIFGIAFYQLKTQNDALIAQNKSTIELLEMQQDALQIQLGKIEEQNKILSKQLDAQREISNTQKEISIETLKIAQSQVTAEQFNNAIHNLGNENQAVVLGGIHALNHLAMKHDEYRQQVFDILCSFLREETVKEEYQKRILASIDSSEEPYIPDTSQQVTSRVVIQTIVDRLFREEKSSELYQQYNANLRGAFLRGINFCKASGNLNWQKADLQNVDLQGVSLEGAHLQEANFCGAKMQGALLVNAKLQKAVLVKSEFMGADLSHANLQETVLNNANLQKANLSFADLRKADLSNANLQEANFNKANLRGADLSYTILQEAVLNNANLQGADLSYAKLQKAMLVNANLRGTTNLGFADLQEADLSGANLEGVTLGSANLKKSILIGASLQEAVLVGANFEEANLSSAKLLNVDLSLADLCGADLHGANLCGALLCGTKLHKTKIENADFRGVSATLNTVIHAAEQGTGLSTDLSGITLYDDDGNKLDLTEDQKVEWFREQGAKVDDLTAEEVQQLAKELEYQE